MERCNVELRRQLRSGAGALCYSTYSTTKIVCAAYEAFCDPPPVRPLRSEIRERNRVLVQVVLDVPALEPCLPDGPFGRPDGGRAEDIRGARLPVRGPVEHVRPEVDVMYVLAWGEAETEPRGFARAGVCSLLVGCGKRTSGERVGTEERRTKTVVVP